jgi:hypothetical protein
VKLLVELLLLVTGGERSIVISGVMDLLLKRRQPKAEEVQMASNATVQSSTESRF